MRDTLLPTSYGAWSKSVEKREGELVSVARQLLLCITDVRQFFAADYGKGRRSKKAI